MRLATKWDTIARLVNKWVRLLKHWRDSRTESILVPFFHESLKFSRVATATIEGPLYRQSDALRFTDISDQPIRCFTDIFDQPVRGSGIAVVEVKSEPRLVHTTSGSVTFSLHFRPNFDRFFIRLLPSVLVTLMHEQLNYIILQSPSMVTGKPKIQRIR
jgi:hypothetical protein